MIEPSSESNDERDDEVIDASTLPDTSSGRGGAANFVPRRRWIGEQPTLVRFVTRILVPTSIHHFVRCGTSKLTLQCNGAVCALCLAKYHATPSYLMPVLFAEDGEIGVIDFAQEGGAGSMRGIIVAELKKPDAMDAIYEVSMTRRRFSLARLGLVPELAAAGGDYGTSVLADLAARGGIRARDVRATVERRDNRTLLHDADGLAQRIRLYHPGLDLATLR